MDPLTRSLPAIPPKLRDFGGIANDPVRFKISVNGRTSGHLDGISSHSPAGLSQALALALTLLTTMGIPTPHLVAQNEPRGSATTSSANESAKANPASLPQRDPISLPEMLMAFWRPEFAAFEPKVDSWQMEYRDIAEQILNGDFAGGIAAMDAREADSKAMSPQPERRLVHLLWRMQLAQRQSYYPYDSGMMQDGRALAGTHITAEMAGNEYAAMARDLGKNLKGDAAFMANGYGRFVMTKVFLEEPSTLRRMQAIKRAGPAFALQSGAGANFVEIGESAIANDHTFAENNKLVPKVTLRLLEADLRGRVAIAKGDRAKAKEEYEKGLAEARNEGLLRAEAYFLLLLGDNEFVTSYNCPETLFLALDLVHLTRAILNQAGGFLTKPLDPNRQRNAEPYYESVKTLLPNLPSSEAAKYEARLLLREAMSYDGANVGKAIPIYEQALKLLAQETNDVTLTGLSMGMHAILSADWEEYGRAVQLLIEKENHGGLAALSDGTGGISMLLNASGNSLTALAVARMGRTSLEGTSACLQMVDLISLEAYLAGQAGQVDRQLALLQDALDELGNVEKAEREAQQSLYPRVIVGGFDIFDKIRTIKIHIINGMLPILDVHFRKVRMAGGDGVIWKQRHDQLLEHRRKLIDEAQAKPALNGQQPIDEAVQPAVSAQIHSALTREISEAYHSPELGTVYQRVMKEASAEPWLQLEISSFASDRLPEARDDAERLLKIAEPVAAVAEAIAKVDSNGSPSDSVGLNKAISELDMAIHAALRLKAWNELEGWMLEIRAAAASQDAREWANLLDTTDLLFGDIALGRGQPELALESFGKQELRVEAELRKAANSASPLWGGAPPVTPGVNFLPGSPQSDSPLVSHLSGDLRSVTQPNAAPRYAINPVAGIRGHVMLLDKLLQCRAALTSAPGVDVKSNAKESLVTWLKHQTVHSMLLASQAGFNLGDQLSLERAELMRQRIVKGDLTPAEKIRKREMEASMRLEPSHPLPSTLPNRESLEAWLAKLPPKTSVFIFHPTERQVMAWRIESGGLVTMTTIPGTFQEIFTAITSLHRCLVNDLVGWEVPARQLQNLLVRPLGTIDPGETVVVMSNPFTALIPFELLVGPQETPWKLENPVVYAADFGIESGRDEKLPSPGGVQGNQVAVIARAGTSSHMEGEATTIAAMLHTKPLTGADATLGRAAALIPNAKWLHLAAHGTLDVDNPFRSHLMLDDGPVNARLLLDLAKSADMVVLSACDTHNAKSAEVAGLTTNSSTMASFLLGGSARWVIASLWACPDQPAQYVIEEYYTRILQGGEARAEALRAGKAELQQRGKRPHAYAPLVLLIRDPLVLLSDPHLDGRIPAP